MKELYTKWLKDNYEENNLLPPKLSDNQALLFIQNYLLGENWYVVSPMLKEQVNCELVHDILYKYSRKYRKECKKALR